MGTKNNPGKYDCYAKAEPDEPMFVLLARDPLAPLLVTDWAMAHENVCADPAKIEEAKACTSAMRAWRRKHRT